MWALRYADLSRRKCRSAYLNARMPTDNPDKILHMVIESDVAEEFIRQDKSFGRFRMRNGNIRLNRAFYGTIQSAKLWYYGSRSYDDDDKDVYDYFRSHPVKQSM